LLSLTFLILSTPLIAQNRAGVLLFTTKQVSPDSIVGMKGLSDIELNNKTNLFMSVILAKPMIHYLRQMAPGLSDDSLVKTGNYQFSFLIDNEPIYHTELIPGAPRPVQLQTDTVWTKPLIDNQHEGGWWSQFVWNRFMYNRGDKALTDGPHQLKIELRPYLKTTGGNYITGAIIAQGSLALMVKRKPVIDLHNILLTPVKPYPGLEVSSTPFDSNRIKTLKGYIEADVFRHITSVVVLESGRILLEEYFNGAKRDSLHDMRSVGKTFTSALVGAAIMDKHLKSVNQQLKEFYVLGSFDNYTPAKGRITLKELLTMSSGFDGDDDDPQSPGNEENMYPVPDWVKFALDLPVDPVRYHGQWHYFTSGVVLLGDILNKSVPGGLEHYAKKRLFDPLGILNYRWEYTPQHVPNTAGGIRMNALDFAKFGQLYADKGNWKQQQILNESWVSESLSHQVPLTGQEGEYYGYLFWNKTYSVNNKSYETYYCSGNGGNKIFVFKDQPLVVVITATAYNQSYAHLQADRMMEEFILPAVIE